MPTFVLPIQGYTDLKLSANFVEASHKDFYMSANIVNPFSIHDLQMSAYFKALGNTDLTLRAIFVVPVDLNMSATFLNPTSIASLPMKATFFTHSDHTDLTCNAVFFKKADLPMSVTIIKAGSQDLYMVANFVQINTLPMSATFFAPASRDLRMKAFLGTFVGDLPLSATFIVPGSTDFKASIVIQNYLAPKGMKLTEKPNFDLLPDPKAKNQNTISETLHTLLLGEQAEKKE